MAKMQKGGQQNKNVFQAFSLSWTTTDLEQGWASRSFPFRTFRSFPFF